MENNNRKILDSLIFPLGFIAVLWIIEMVKQMSGSDLGYLGIHPRSLKGIPGIFTSPFIHGGFRHLISNSIPLLVLITIVMHFYRTVAFRSVALIYIITGTLVWLFARKTGSMGNDIYHIGASGIAYGLVAFIFWMGIFIRNRLSIVLALVMVFLYSGMFLGVVPTDDGISWESHLLGALSGIAVAYLLKSHLPEPEPEEEKWEEEENNGNYFLARDTFSKTKNDRAEEENNTSQTGEQNIQWIYKK